MSDHTAQALLIHCMDYRIQEAINEFSKQFAPYDEISLAGGAKDLITEDKNIKDYVIHEVTLSYDLHKIKEIIILNHRDCGGYGGLKAFDNNREAEQAQHAMDLREAGSRIKQKYDVVVRTFFVDFEEKGDTISNVIFVEV